MKSRDLDKILAKAKQLIESGDPASARPLCQKVLNHSRKHHYATFLLGRIFLLQGEYRNAIRSFDSAITAAPDNPEYLFFRGEAHASCQRFTDALVDFGRAHRVQPNSFSLLLAMGDTHLQAGETERAGVILEKALRMAPENITALLELAKKLEQAKNFKATFECYQKALKINEEEISVLHNFAIFLYHHNQSGLALPCLRKILELEPENRDAQINLGSVLSSLRRIPEACAAIRQALKIDPSARQAHSNLLLMMHYDSLYSAEEIFAEHLRWNRQHAEGKHRYQHAHTRFPERSGKKFRVGYVSSDFYTHSVAFFIIPVLQAHNREEFEIFCYANVARPDAITESMRSIEGIVWRDILGQSDEQAAQTIYDDRIDILVDLTGHAGEGRLSVFAFKPAPIQISYLGYPDTTGMSAIDYRLTDGWADPVGETDHLHAEKLYRLPTGFLCYLPPPEALDPSSEPPSLRNGYITFGSLNMSSKISDAVIQMWSVLLLQVPDSKLLIKSKNLQGATAQALLDDFAKRGIASDRITTKAWTSSREEHLELYHSIDIVLDTFPYNGTTMTLEALWMGTPVVTLAGTTHVQRVGFSILSKLGLEELISFSPDEYIEKCAALAEDTSRLTNLSTGMRQRMIDHGILDGVGFTRNLECSFQKMIDGWRNNLTLMAQLPRHWSIKIFGNLDIYIPHALDDYDAYTLIEHEDVSPAPLQFLRELAGQPGTVIDVEAGLGEFAVSTAFTVGPGTSVLAFEADPVRLAFLRINIARNLLNNCHPYQLDFAATAGQESFSSKATGPPASITLDECVAQHRITDLRLVKLGRRCNEFLLGAKQTLTGQSPIIGLSLAGLDEPILTVTMLTDLGYSLFRYCPGLRLLIPAGSMAAAITHDVIFACKPEVISELKTYGLLSDVTDRFSPSPIDREPLLKAHRALFPFAAAFHEKWATMPPLKDWGIYFAGLDAYQTALTARDIEIRVSALFKAQALVAHCCDSAPAFTRLLTLARLTVDAGYDQQALQVLLGLQELLASAPEAIKLTAEPFLPPCPRFDTVAPNGAEGEWLLTAILEQIERLKYPSSYYGEQNDVQRLELLDSTGFTTVSMLRRRQLLRTKLGLQKGFIPSIDLLYPDKGHLNYHLWS